LVYVTKTGLWVPVWVGVAATGGWRRHPNPSNAKRTERNAGHADRDASQPILKNKTEKSNGTITRLDCFTLIQRLVAIARAVSRASEANQLRK
jgi:hypothetical protein